MQVLNQVFSKVLEVKIEEVARLQVCYTNIKAQEHGSRGMEQG